MATSNAVGDIQEPAVQPMVAALPLGIVTLAEASDIDHPINNRLYSGKKTGSCYLLYVPEVVEPPADAYYDIIVGCDSDDDDLWYKVSDGTAITPV